MHPPERKPSPRELAELALADLCDGFLPRDDWTVGVEPVEPDFMPDPFCSLLLHHDHMTTRLGQHYGSPVELRVLQSQQTEDEYNRLIVLNPRGSKQIVEVGVVRINLPEVPSAARSEVLAMEKPLGEILITHKVLRRIDPRWYYRFLPTSPLSQHFGTMHAATYGRWGVIYCDHRPAIRLLEIVSGV